MVTDREKAAQQADSLSPALSDADMDKLATAVNQIDAGEKGWHHLMDVALSIAQQPAEWVERWYGSGPERGWWIVCGRDHIAHLGPSEFAEEAAEKICAAHNRTRPQARKPTVDDDSQDWRGMDGAIAWHLIDRHADGWSDVGKMMGEWLEANQTQPAQQEPVGEVARYDRIHWYDAGTHIPTGTKLYTHPQAREPLTIEQEREAFESHWYTFYHSGSIHARSDGSYVHPAVQKAWEAWQARAAHGIKERA